MILNNYKNFRKLFIYSNMISKVAIPQNANYTDIVNTLGETTSNGYKVSDEGYFASKLYWSWIDISVSKESLTVASSYRSYLGLHIGNGYTEVTENDYILNSPYKPGTDYNVISFTIEQQEIINRKLIVKYKLIGTAINALTIKESCLDTNLGFHSGNTSSNYKKIMLTRNVLETPLEVSAGEDFSVTETLEIPL